LYRKENTVTQLKRPINERYIRKYARQYYIFSVCVCSLSFAACKAHAQYYIVKCGWSGSIIFFHIILYKAWFS